MTMRVAVASQARQQPRGAPAALGADAPARVVLVLSNRPDAAALEARAQWHFRRGTDRPGGRGRVAGPAGAPPGWTCWSWLGTQARARRRHRSLPAIASSTHPALLPGFGGGACTAITRARGRAGERCAREWCHRPSGWTRCTTAAHTGAARVPVLPEDTPVTLAARCSQSSIGCFPPSCWRPRLRAVQFPSRDRGVHVVIRRHAARAISVSDKRHRRLARGLTQLGWRSSPRAAPPPRSVRPASRSCRWRR
jgi:hypothetical protein